METAEHPIWRGRIWASVLAVLLLVPFVNKAFHLDDTLFLISAQQIVRAPMDFYGADINWYGTTMRMADVIKNPPLASYYIALVMFLFGTSELVLHLAFLVPAVALAVGTHELARRFCRRPLLAVGISLLTPVVWVSSTNVMCDTMMAAFWVWSVVLWLKGMDQDRAALLYAGAALAALAALTKYFGMGLIPLLAAYALLRTRRLGHWTMALILPVALLGAYQGYTHALYGRSLLLDAARYATATRPQAIFSAWPTVIGLCFLGGSMAPALFLSPWLWSKKGLAAGALLLAAATLFFLWMAPQGVPSGLEADPALGDAVNGLLVAQCALWTTAGIGIWVLSASEVVRLRTADALLLGLWIAGTFIFAAFINWTVNARSLLPMAPAVAVLVSRRLERLHAAAAGPPSPPRTTPERTGFPSPGQWMALGLAATLALAVTWADYTLAGSARNAAIRLATTYAAPGKTLWFQGHWGFQFYMQRLGALPLDGEKPAIQAGELCVIPLNNTNIHPPPPEAAIRVATEMEPVCRWASTMCNLPVGAGFYSNLRRPLPFAFARIPPEPYWILRATAP